jgi:hypothetical protein
MSDPETARPYDAAHMTGSGADPDERVPVIRRSRFSRHQRSTITRGILLFVVTLVLCQLWLFTATLNAYLGGDTSVIWPGLLASLACLGLNIGLLRQLYWLEAPAAPIEGGRKP